MLIVSPRSSVRRHDRILCRRRSGEIELGILLRRTAQRVSIGHFTRPEDEQSIDNATLAWVARILWISQ
jgi:hypothetical protein